jgi:hypothetical protein
VPETKYNRDTQRFDFIGIDLNRPVDSVKPSKMPYARNCRSFVAGRLECRDGLTLALTGEQGTGPAHSIRRLNDPDSPNNANPFARVAGVGPDLFVGGNSLTKLDTGYSGDPLALVPWKPLASPRSFMYIGDRSRMRKVTTSSDLHTIGLPAPAVSPSVTLAPPQSNEFELFDQLLSTGGQSSWTKAIPTGSGTGTLVGSDANRTPDTTGPPPPAQPYTPVTTTITQILYDGPIPGWASVQLADMSGLGRGEYLRFPAPAAEYAMVQDVFPGGAIVNTTIAQIIYDSGSVGPCAIALTTPIDQLVVNSLLQLSVGGTTELVRVQGVLPAPDGTYSIRTSTVGTWAATNNITLLPSFRIFLSGNPIGTPYAVGTLVGSQAVEFTIPTTATTAVFTKGPFAPLYDLTQLPSGPLTTVPVQKDDYMSIGIKVDHPENISLIRVQLDVDNNDGATSGFTKNYYFREIRTSDLTPTISPANVPLITNGSTILQRQVVDQGNSVNASSIFGTALKALDLYALGIPKTVKPQVITNFSRTSTGFPTNNVRNPGTGGNPFLNPFIPPFLPGGGGLPGQVTTPASDPSVYSNQLESGANVWVDVWFRISDLLRVGTDDTKSLQNVRNLQIVVVMTGQATTATNVSLNSWTIHGGYGPDDLQQVAQSYYYRYRARVLSTTNVSASTNVPSNWSPATRLSIDPYRQAVSLTPPTYSPPTGTTFQTTDFVLDFQRFGGLLATWNYVGTVPNGQSFTDKIADIVAAQNPSELQINYQPWPIIGLPQSGQTAVVAGTSVQCSIFGQPNLFNVNWAPGTRIMINQQPFIIYRVISNGLLELVNSAGFQTVTSWSVPEPTILNQPLPCLWEWDGVWFGCGDPINPGRLYYSNPDSETTTPDNYYDLTSPSEPLQNGLQYNLRSYVFSSEAFIQVLQTGNPADPYRHEHIPNGKGLFSRWALTREPSPIICFLTKDGIYLTNGGAPSPLTDADLYELFPNEGNLGVVINTITPPNVVASQATNLRLTYYDEYLYFDYIDINGGRATLALVFDLGAATRGEAPGGWVWDNYTPAAAMHYGEEGSSIHDILLGCTDGNFYQYTANTNDAGNPITMDFFTPSRDMGDPRQTKFFGDMMVDANTAGITTTCTPYLNNNAQALASTTINTSTRSQSVIPVSSASLATGLPSWTSALNLSLFVTLQVTGSARPFFYIYDTRWTFDSAPMSAQSWEFSDTSFGMEGFKHVGLCKVAYSSAVALTMTVTVDGKVGSVSTLPANGGILNQYIFRVPVMKGKLFKFRVASSDGSSNFKLDTRDSFVEIKDWGKDAQYSNLRVFSDYSLVEG